MTNVECTNCREVLEVTATSIMLPFICDTCREDAAQYKAMAPAAVEIKSYTEYPNLIESPEPSHDATVENTTLLIADLEEQVTFATEALAKSTELVNELSAELQDTVSVIGERDKKVADLDRRNTILREDNSQIHRLNETLMQNLITVIARKNDIAEKYRTGYADFVEESLQIARDADAVVEKLNAEVTSWKQATADAVKARDNYKERSELVRRWFNELSAKHNTMNARGFWKRVFNAGA